MGGMPRGPGVNRIMTLKAVLFDLDNTLIRFSEREFFESYVSRVSEAFSDIMPPDVFVSKLLLSTQALVDNRGEMSNADYFMNAFVGGYEDRREEIWGRFLSIKQSEYDRVPDLMTLPKGVREVLLYLKRRRTKIVIASNPIWPLEAQLKRLSWAGLADLQFDLVAHIENMSYCKPHVEFYREVCAKIDESPETCLMVGNDPVNDMVVATIGMKTFLVVDESTTEDSALELSRSFHSRAPAEIPAPDFVGPISGVPDAVEVLLGSGAGS